jgi:hypothetical protein
MFHVQCPLGHTLEIGPEHFGQRMLCPICQAVVFTPTPPMGKAPYAKYEVECPQGHILRVKQKYLNKEVRCPACQGVVIMKPEVVLTASGATLGATAPHLLTSRKPIPKPKKPAPPKPPPARQPPPQTRQPTPPPPSMPLTPELATDSLERPQLPTVPSPASAGRTVSDYDDLELEIIDTQLKIDMNAEAAPTKPGPRGGTRREMSSGRIPEPPPRSPAPALSTEDIQVTCPNGHLLAVERQYEGQQVQCPICQAVLQVPLPPYVEE